MAFELKKWITVNSNGELGAADGVSGVIISADKRVATIPGFGTVDISKSPSKAVIRLSVDFDGTIDLTGSNVTKVAALYGATNGKLTYKATDEDKIVGGSGADSITLGASTASIDLGAGNDVVSLGTGASNVTLGSGADLIQVKAEAYGKVADYNFAEGDAISLDGPLADAGKISVIAGTGEVALDGGTNLKIMSTKNDGVYAAKFTEGSITGLSDYDVTYFTAAENSGKVNIDASGSEIAVIDASESTGANIVSGAGADTISLGGNGADTIVIGKSSGDDEVYNFGAEDVLRFVGGSLDKLAYDTTNDILTFADSTVKFGTALTNDDSASLTANVAFGDADAESFALANSAGATLQQADAVKGYVGFSDGSTVLKVSKSVDLNDTAHFANIANVEVKNNTEAATVIGALKKVDATAATGTVNVLSTEKDASIILATAKKSADTVWIGSTDVKVTNFTTGFGKTADTLVLYDVSDVKDISVNGNVVTAGSAKIEMTGVSDNIAANVVLKGGVAKKIVISSGDVELDKDSLDLDVLSTSKKNATLNVAANVTDGGKNVVSINLNDEKYADSFKNVSSASSVGTTNIIGSATVDGATITVTGNGDHNIWAANTGANTITLGGTGKKSVWYNAIDGKDTVTGFTKNDTVLLYGGEMVGSSAINSAYKIKYDGATVKFASGDSALALNGLVAGNTFTVMDNAGDTYKVQLANADKLTYDKDTKFYVADSTVAATTLNVVGYDASETVALVVNGDADGNIIAGNVTEINAGASSVKTLLVGSAEAATKLVGGKTENHFWGGSKDSDVMFGNSAAFDDFWFGTLDGKDTANSVNADDRVYLYDVNSADINTIAKLSIDESSASADLSLEGGAILGINASKVSDFDSIVFRTGDGVDFTYDKESKTFVKKS